MQPFLRLDQLLLPPPLAALSGLLLAIGIAGLGIAAARRLRGSRFEVLDGAAGVVLAAAVLGAGLHGLALFGLLRLGFLRGLAALLALVGVLTAIRYGPVLLRSLRILNDRFCQWALLDRALAVLLALTALGLFLAALGPASDADSVGYHLGVPLDWLRHGGAEPRPDWQYARLIGLGEMLDLLGLAGGSDSLGAILQWVGAVVAALAATAFAHRERDRLLIAALVLSSPVLLTLVPAQKPQLLPAAGVALALILIVRRWNDLDRSTLVLAFAGAAFAMGCKYSFLFSGSAVVIAGLVASRRIHAGSALAAATVTVLLLAAPVYLRNLAFYGDPLSPFLERWRATPDPSLMDLAAYLSGYGGHRNAGSLFRFFTHSIAGRPINSLGLGVLIPLLTPWSKSSARRLLVVASAVAALELTFSELTPRFFLEPFLWGIAAVGLRERPLGTAVAALLTMQAAVTAAGAVTCAFVLFPGSWSGAWRDRVLSLHAPGYAESRWLDRVLRPNDVLLTGVWSAAFLPRPFVFQDRFDGYRPEEVERSEIRGLELDAGVSVLTIGSDDDPSQAILDAASEGTIIEGAHSFPAGTRNPFIHVPDVELRTFRLSQ